MKAAATTAENVLLAVPEESLVEVPTSAPVAWGLDDGHGTPDKHWGRDLQNVGGSPDVPRMMAWACFACLASWTRLRPVRWHGWLVDCPAQ
jgi:hypothetical protein